MIYIYRYMSMYIQKDINYIENSLKQFYNPSPIH